jgi:hypothetical protein
METDEYVTSNKRNYSSDDWWRRKNNLLLFLTCYFPNYCSLNIYFSQSSFCNLFFKNPFRINVNAAG